MLFEQTPDGATQETVLGSGNLLPAIELAVVGMNTGDRKTLNVPPSQAFGERLEQLVFRLSRNQIPPEAEIGSSLKVKFQGQEGLVMVVSLEEEIAVLDANHPLAGRTLELQIELVEVLGEGT